MAKKKKANDIAAGGANKESGGSKVLSTLIVLLIVAIWLAVIGFMIKMDFGGLGSKVLAPVLRDVPLINRILPDASTSDTYQDQQGTTYKNLDEAMVRIQELEQQINSISGSGSANTDYIAELEAENARLKVFEEGQKAFDERVAEFDKNVVFNDKAPTPEEYIAYYQQINPENAALLYQQAVEQTAVSKKIQEQGTKFSNMDPASAAQILEIMTGDLDLVCQILGTMKPEQSAAILQEMSPEYAAKITKKSSILE